MDAQSSHFRSLYHLEEVILVGGRSEYQFSPKYEGKLVSAKCSL